MLDDIRAIKTQFTDHQTLDGRIDQVFEEMKALGFEALISAFQTGRPKARR